LWSAPSGLAFVLGALMTPWIASRARPPFVIATGFFVAALGFALLTQAGKGHDLVVVASAYAVFTLASDLVVSTAPPERAGAAAGMSEMSAELGGALGIALLGSIATYTYRGAFTAAAGADLPPEALAVARDTLGAAGAAADSLPSERGAALLAFSRHAFVEGFRATAIACAAIALGAAAGAALVLGRVSVR